MKRPTLVHTAGLVLALCSSAAVAQECPRPAVRTTNALVTAIAQDEVMAAAFENTAAACQSESASCDEAKVKCGQQLTTVLQQQLNFDEGAYLRDMLIAYQSQQYRMQVPIAAPVPLTDVSCNVDAAGLRQAAARRKQQAERRKVVTAEYPRWIAWVNNQYKSCTDRTAVEKSRVDAASAEAARLLAAAEAAKQAELIKQDQKAAAERAAREKAEADAKAKEEALRAQQDAAAEAAKQRAKAEQAQKDQIEEQKRAQERAAEEARRAKETAEEKAAREAKEAADARLVADREAKKAAAEQKQRELIEKENAREGDVKARAEAKRAAAEAAHQRKVEELKRSIELSEADRAAQLAEVDKEYAEGEEKRKEQALKEISAAGEIDRSDERLGGALSVHPSGGFLSIGAESYPVVGGQLTLRHGFWGTAPASGLASGMELRATATFLLSPDGRAYVIQVAPEIRYWLTLFGIGAAFDYQRVQLAPPNVATDTVGLGPTISIAAIDNPAGRLIFTVRWTPFLNEQYERVTGEIEGGYQVFSFAVQGGIIKQGRLVGATGAVVAYPLGFFVSGSLGVRLRW